MQMRLCNNCWTQWKKLGGIKTSHEYGIRFITNNKNNLEHYDLDGSTELSQNHSSRSNNNRNLVKFFYNILDDIVKVKIKNFL